MDKQKIQNYVSAQWDAQRNPGKGKNARKNFINWLVDGLETETVESFGVDTDEQEEVDEMNEYIRSLE